MRCAALLFLLCFAGALPAADGPLVGKAAPRLEISHAVQGAAWSQDSLLGSVVVLDIFQLG